MRWKKSGKVFAPAGEHEWMLTHAANPFAIPLSHEMTRVYFNSRDASNRASICSLDMRLKPEPTVVRVASEPVLVPGEAGLFDDSGVSLGCVVCAGNRLFLYYVGWNLSVTVPWRNSIGLAIAEAGSNEFHKYSRAPIVDRNEADPFSMSYPSVIREGDEWRMYYGSNLDWGKNGSMRHVIKYATSVDGISWQRDGRIAIDLQGDDECAVSRPSVLKGEGLYQMWYSRRGQTYRIGYAESVDGVEWTRRDDAVGIDVSKSGWDSEMIEYAHVFDHAGERYMLYNGNGYGRTGFGLAVADHG